ncbi:MAG: glycine zipper domain-containing protein [Thermodesulfobacteriota bacterium]
MQRFLAVFAIVALVVGCTPTKSQMGAAGGSVAGALIGQAIGRNTGGTLIGAAVGGMLGYIVGNEMDKYDQKQVTRVYESAPSGQPASWTNPDTGKQYTMTPRAAYQDSRTSQVCREAEIEATIDGRKEKVLSTACRDAAGNWVMQ